MDDQDDEFVREFMARAEQRKAKLEVKGDVSYPPLSPLEEETEAEDLNYSSDLSLGDEQSEQVFRAEPVICHSSPLQEVAQYQHPQLPSRRAPSPEKIPSDKIATPYKRSVPYESSSTFERATPFKRSELFDRNSPVDKRGSSEEMRSRVERANHTRIQLKKAVEASKHGSREHIEAARLLQITENEHLAYSQRAAKLELGEYHKPESLGSLKLSGIELRMSSRLRDELAEDNVSHYFLCIATCGVDVRATEVIDTNLIRKQATKTYMQFKEKLCFEDLPPDFNVKLEVFELVVGQHMSKLMTRLTPSKKSRISPQLTFKRVGSLKLTLADRKETYKKLTQWSENERSKFIESECKFRIELRSEQLPSASGMVHLRTLDKKGKPYWSYHWAELSGSHLNLWMQKDDSTLEKQPDHTIDVGEICCENVQILSPDDDLYRRNSFVIYTIEHTVDGRGDRLFQRTIKDDPSLKIIRHQFAVENREERDLWCSYLNRSMNCYREWHGRTRLYTLDDISEMFLPRLSDKTCC